MYRRLLPFSAVCTPVIIVAILMLIPSPGLISLTVPDETDGGPIIAITDFSDFAKRVGDSFHGLDAALISFGYSHDITPKDAYALPLSGYIVSGAVGHITIRGPPADLS